MKDSTGQMRLATKDLAEAIKRGEVRSSAFTTKQLKAIEKGESKNTGLHLASSSRHWKDAID